MSAADNTPIALPPDNEYSSVEGGKKPRTRRIFFAIGFCILAFFIAARFLGLTDSPSTSTAPPSSTSEIPCIAATSLATSSIAPTPYDLEEAKANWNILASEDFNGNQTKWRLENKDNSDSTTFSEIHGGIYYYSRIMKPDYFGGWFSPFTKSVSDFYLTAEFKQLGDDTSYDYGLVFRSDRGNRYFFGIIDDEFFVVIEYVEKLSDSSGIGHSDFPIERTRSTAIKLHKPNRMSVLAQGTHFAFFVNDKLVAELTNECYKQGKGSAGIGVRYPFKNAEIEIDNFELRAP